MNFMLKIMGEPSGNLYSRSFIYIAMNRLTYSEKLYLIKIINHDFSKREIKRGLY